MQTNTIVTIVAILQIFACANQQDGTVQGKVSPAEPIATISIDRNGKPVTSCNTTTEGTFSVHIKAGVYTLRFSSSATTYPVTITDIVIKANETTLVPPVNLGIQLAKAVVSGKVTPVCPGAKVKLICEGKERAAAHIGAEGKYEFSELPAGNYTIRTEAPGYAGDTSSLTVSAEQKTEHNILLLPIIETAGVDWASGKIRATGHGLPPIQSASNTVRHELTKRAALTDAERNLLKIVQNIRINSSQDVKSYMQNTDHEVRIQGFIRGYTIVNETEHDDGSVDVTLELPLTGPTGLTRYITE
jgi:hypothetical protein